MHVLRACASPLFALIHTRVPLRPRSICVQAAQASATKCLNNERIAISVKDLKYEELQIREYPKIQRQ
jgi:hypothetical protein